MRRWSDVNVQSSKCKLSNKHAYSIFTYLQQILLALACISKLIMCNGLLWTHFLIKYGSEKGNISLHHVCELHLCVFVCFHTGRRALLLSGKGQKHPSLLCGSLNLSWAAVSTNNTDATFYMHVCVSASVLSPAPIFSLG